MSDTKNYETRKTLISKFGFSLEAELLDADRAKVYDDNFLLRMGQEAQRYLRSFVRLLGWMVGIDVLVLLTISGISFNVVILGNKFSTFPGVVELGILLTSLSYMSNTIDGINYATYKRIIYIVLENKHPKNNPSFFMGSLLPENYVSNILDIKPSVWISGCSHTIFAGILQIMTFVVPACLYVLHFITVWLSIDHIKNTNDFGALGSQLIVATLWIINLTSFFLYILGIEYPFKFRASVPTNNS